MPESDTQQPCLTCRFGENGNKECQYLEHLFIPPVNVDGVCTLFKDITAVAIVQEISSDTFLRKGFTKKH